MDHAVAEVDGDTVYLQIGRTEHMLGMYIATALSAVFVLWELALGQFSISLPALVALAWIAVAVRSFTRGRGNAFVVVDRRAGIFMLPRWNVSLRVEQVDSLQLLRTDTGTSQSCNRELYVVVTVDGDMRRYLIGTNPDVSAVMDILKFAGLPLHEFAPDAKPLPDAVSAASIRHSSHTSELPSDSAEPNLGSLWRPHSPPDLPSIKWRYQNYPGCGFDAAFERPWLRDNGDRMEFASVGASIDRPFRLLLWLFSLGAAFFLFVLWGPRPGAIGPWPPVIVALLGPWLLEAALKYMLNARSMRNGPYFQISRTQQTIELFRYGVTIPFDQVERFVRFYIHGKNRDDQPVYLIANQNGARIAYFVMIRATGDDLRRVVLFTGIPADVVDVSMWNESRTNGYMFPKSSRPQ